MIRTLAIETSCDETSAAVLEDMFPLSNIISSQESHNKFGGVVPENASREHVKNILRITNTALEKAKVNLGQIDLIAATYTPGLIGAILVGLNFAKSLAASLDKPFIPVNHIHAHIYSVYLEKEKPEFPFLSLIVSGGHTLLILVTDFFKHKIVGSTIDDAAGESFDKTAKMLGLGYPGGPLIDKLAEYGNPEYQKFPLPEFKNKDEFSFSFSGLKTSVLYFLKKIEFEKLSDEKRKEIIPDIAASFRTAAVKQLLRTTIKASEKYNVRNICIAGGVSANKLLKDEFQKLRDSGYKIFIPSIEYSTDNAAMIGVTGFLKFNFDKDCKELINSLEVNASPKINRENF